jgi:beta-RFAP synthase
MFEGPLAGRAAAFAKRFANSIGPIETPPRAIRIESCQPEHVGLGTGTQLGLGVAKALACSWDCDRWTSSELAIKVGRGLRSSIGVHGFERGGLIAESGKLESDQIAPLLLQLPFPDDWRVVVAVPPCGSSMHGELERSAFERLKASEAEFGGELCRLIVQAMLPAVQQQRFREFSESVFEFNARVGEWFRPVQHGRYASRASEELVARIRSWGFAGVGQSSWGPALFAFAESEPQAEDLKSRLPLVESRIEHIWVARASAGAEITCE